MQILGWTWTFGIDINWQHFVAVRPLFFFFIQFWTQITQMVISFFHLFHLQFRHRYIYEYDRFCTEKGRRSIWDYVMIHRCAYIYIYTTLVFRKCSPYRLTSFRSKRGERCDAWRINSIDDRCGRIPEIASLFGLLPFFYRYKYF